MPAWGELLPETVIWDLVSYISSISDAPGNEWGTIFSPVANLPAIEPAIEQVPAEFNESAKPFRSPRGNRRGNEAALRASIAKLA
jgi:cytochrome c oxidase cbb3-type subunit 3